MVTPPGVLWDFDGTIALRPREWRGVLMELLDEDEPGHGADIEALRLRTGFPWHAPEIAHPHLADPAAWWASVTPVIAAAYRRAGLPEERAARLAGLVRERYTDAARGWSLVDGALAAVDRLRAAGWRQAILSNHVPELPRLVRELGIADRFEAVITSAATGVEKPHPRMFALGRAALGALDAVWMVGDSVEADVLGAERAGMRALLVQNPGRPEQPGAVPVAEVASRLLAAS